MQPPNKKCKLDFPSLIKNETFDVKQKPTNLWIWQTEAHHVFQAMQQDASCKENGYKILHHVPRHVPGLCSFIVQENTDLTFSMMHTFYAQQDAEQYLPQLIAKHQASAENVEKILCLSNQRENMPVEQAYSIVDAIMNMLRSNTDRLEQLSKFYKLGSVSYVLLPEIQNMFDIVQKNDKWLFYWLCLMGELLKHYNKDELVLLDEVLIWLPTCLKTKNQKIIIAIEVLLGQQFDKCIEALPVEIIEMVFITMEEETNAQHINLDHTFISNSMCSVERQTLQCLQLLCEEATNLQYVFQLVQRAASQTENVNLFVRGLGMSYMLEADGAINFDEFTDFFKCGLKIIENPFQRTIPLTTLLYKIAANHINLAPGVLFCHAMQTLLLPLPEDTLDALLYAILDSLTQNRSFAVEYVLNHAEACVFIYMDTLRKARNEFPKQDEQINTILQAALREATPLEASHICMDIVNSNQIVDGDHPETHIELLLHAIKICKKEYENWRNIVTMLLNVAETYPTTVCKTIECIASYHCSHANISYWCEIVGSLWNVVVDCGAECDSLACLFSICSKVDTTGELNRLLEHLEINSMDDSYIWLVNGHYHSKDTDVAKKLIQQVLVDIEQDAPSFYKPFLILYNDYQSLLQENHIAPVLSICLEAVEPQMLPEPVLLGLLKCMYQYPTLAKQYFAQISDCFSNQHENLHHLLATSLLALQKTCTTIEWDDLLENGSIELVHILKSIHTRFEQIPKYYRDMKIVHL